MSDIPENPMYDVHAVIMKDDLHKVIEFVSHLPGVVFKVEIHNAKSKTPTCRTRGTNNE